MRELVDQCVVFAMREIVKVLHADDVAYAASLFDLRRRDITQPDMTHQALPLEIGQNRKRRFERPFCGMMQIEHAPQIHDIDRFDTKIADVVVLSFRTVEVPTSCPFTCGGFGM